MTRSTANPVGSRDIVVLQSSPEPANQDSYCNIYSTTM